MDIKPWPDTCMVNGVPTLKCLETVVSNLLVVSSALIVVTLFIMFVTGSLQYLTSGGNPEKVKKAQGTLRYALVGTILFIGSYLILNVIDILFLGGEKKLFNLDLP